jgi:hypothetical protein
MAFSKFKAFLKRIAARTVDDLVFADGARDRLNLPVVRN